MNDQATIDPDRDRADDFTGPPVTAAEVALLQKLALIGADVACEAREREKAKRQRAAVEANEAAAKATEAAANQETKTFERMSRMVGMTIRLKAKLVMDLERWRRRIAEAAAAPAKDADRRRRAEVKRNVGDILNEVVGKTHGPKAAASVAQRINRWFAARDYETQLPDLPVGELAARIARELGYKIVWSDWGHRFWAAAAEAADPPEPPYTPPEIQRVVFNTVVTEDGDIIPVTLGILQPDGSIVPEAPPDAPAAEDAAPPPEQKSPAQEAAGPDAPVIAASAGSASMPVQAPAPEPVSQPPPAQPAGTNRTVRGVQPFQNPSIYWP